ncbi:TetR family transcriptional regulator C-terminal domain-containing protein [Gordonia shandongensis]|uniref:TetR family transcriptional regulator C-terminal domain-containing protein n=1 Tax=Gordonia shandongensis TaxID=376351 RepID=UPI00047E6FDB|nr:TetR family transcriptional regulator C-terminal domain-containing protein [Gordonia shandongensis]
MSETSTTVGDRARIAIRDSGMAQREVCRRIGLDESKMSKSLSGTRRFAADELVRLATVAGVTVDWLMTGGTGAAEVPADLLPARHDESAEQALARRTIVEKAWWLFAEHGYDGVRIADIAEAADVSSASIHYYFDGKRAIFGEVLRYSVKLAFDRQQAQLHSIDDPVQRLRRLIRLQLPVGRQGRAEWAIWLQVWTTITVTGDGQGEHVGSYRRWWNTVRDIVDDGRERGVFYDEPLDDVVDALTAFIDGLGIRVLTGMLTGEEMADQVDAYIDRNLTVD